jgi:hypothetical protein
VTKTPEKVIADFNRYFTSANNIDVPARTTVQRDEWRSVLSCLQQIIDERDALRVELDLAKNVNLSVVNRLQKKVDALEKEMREDAKYMAWQWAEVDRLSEPGYQCGEL